MTRFSPKTELFYDGVWNDITPDVYTRDQIQITRGRADEGARADPGSCRLTINNRGGKYSPRNPLSPLYGKIGRNTPIRVSETSLLNRQLVNDTFTRTLTGGWGVTTSGHPYWMAGGAASERAVNGLVGTITIASDFATTREQYIADFLNGEAVVSVKMDQLPAPGIQFITGVIFRRDVSGRAFRLGLQIPNFSDSGNCKLFVYGRDGNLVGPLTPLPFAATTGKIWLRAQIIGQRIRGRAWLDGSTEPTTWSHDTDLGATTGPTAGKGSNPVTGGVGIACEIGGTPAGPVVFAYDDLKVTDPVSGVRFVGEVPSWPARWDVSGKDVYVPIEAAGILRRLGQGASPLRSAMYRARTGGNPDGNADVLVGYWPCEDGEGATQVASALGHPPGQVKGTGLTFAAFDGFLPSAPVLTMGTSGVHFELPVHETTHEISVLVLVAFPAGGATAGKEIFSVRSTGSAHLWVVRYEGTDGGGPGTGGDLSLTVYDVNGTQLATSGVWTGNAPLGQPLAMRLRVSQLGTAADGLLCVGKILPSGIAGVPCTFATTASGHTVGRAVRVNLASGHGMGGTAMGHVAVASSTDNAVFSFFDEYFNAYSGERAGNRIARLCREEGVPFAPYGALGPGNAPGAFDVDTTELMGPQRIATFLDLLDEAAAVDGGILYETRWDAGLTYRTRVRFYNQADVGAGNLHDRPLLALDYGAGHISPPFEPIDDDSDTRNDITVQRAGGSSARAVRESGPLNVHTPTDDPDGVGRYEEQVTLLLNTDGQVADHAGWRLHLGTWDEPRYPSVTVDVAKNPALLVAVTGVESGDRFTLANLPSWLPPGTVDLRARGYTETFDEYWWDWTANTSPGEPYQIAEVAHPDFQFFGSDAATLSVALTTIATSVAINAGAGPDWVREANFDITIGGERMTVTAVGVMSGTFPNRACTLTVVRSVNGVVKTHAVGAGIELFHKIHIGL